MSEKHLRRSFLSRLGAGLGSLMALPLAANPFRSSIENNMENNSKSTPVYDIQPMGFQWETLDPFLFCVHHQDFFPKGNDKMGPAESLAGRQLGDDFIVKNGYRMYHGKVVPGFPGHPHRGFETVTVVRKGLVDHADSMGAAGRYGNGDVQWMTAGGGVQHSEMFPLIHDDKVNTMELFQIWLNLPAKKKMVSPHFKMLWAENIPHYEHTSPSGKTHVEIIAGSIDKLVAQAPPPDSWAAVKENQVAIWNIKMEPNAVWELPTAPAFVNRRLYYYIGKGLKINQTEIPGYHSLTAKAEAKLILKNGPEEARILLLQGKPIGEPVIQYGPFVMNTKEEIQKAFDDYHKTEFGGWPWPRRDQVHDRSLGRFAKHADGRKETRQLKG